VPRRLHARIAEGGRFFRRLPPGTHIDHGDTKLPPSQPPRPKKAANGAGSAAAQAARIDEDVDEPADAFHWEVSTVDAGEEGEIPWNFTSSSEESLKKATELLEESLERARNETHVGFLQIPVSLVPRVIGRGGSGLEKIRSFGVSVDFVGRKNSDTREFGVWGVGGMLAVSSKLTWTN
jgi:hypothetical protein